MHSGTEMHCSMKSILFTAAGSISLFAGIAGIFLPVLPTTPFLLLAAFLYMKGSKRLYYWLINHRLLGLYVRSYIEHRAITQRAKIVSIAALWAAIAASAVFFVDVLWLRILLLIIAAGVTAHLLHMKTLTKQMIDEED